jgi:hypothetical protein
MRKTSHWQHGQGLPEYATILGLVALASAIVLGLLGLALARQYGLVAGVLGARKDVQTASNHVYFDTNPPQCGVNYFDDPPRRHLYMQFFTDIKPYLTATTEKASIPMKIEANGVQPAGSGVGDWLIDTPLDPGVSCPLSVVIQSDKEHGGVTVAWHVLQKDWKP